MPKHIIEFQIPEEQEELDLVLNASNVACKIHDWEMFMRNMVKYGNVPIELMALTEDEPDTEYGPGRKALTEDQILTVVDAMRTQYFRIMNEE